MRYYRWLRRDYEDMKVFFWVPTMSPGLAATHIYFWPSCPDEPVSRAGPGCVALMCQMPSWEEFLASWEFYEDEVALHKASTSLTSLNSTDCDMVKDESEAVHAMR